MIKKYVIYNLSKGMYYYNGGLCEYAFNAQMFENKTNAESCMGVFFWEKYNGDLIEVREFYMNDKK